jgi:pectin methylesterase-like acyl-CoA thioesterase
MKTLISFFALIAFALSQMGGCATTSSQQIPGTTAASVRNFITDVEPGLKPAATLACTIVLDLAVSAQDRADVKKDLFVVASIVGAANPDETPGDLSKAIQAAIPAAPENKQLADSIAGGFAIALPFIKGDTALFLKVTSDLSGGCAIAATLP